MSELLLALFASHRDLQAPIVTTHRRALRHLHMQVFKQLFNSRLRHEGDREHLSAEVSDKLLPLCLSTKHLPCSCRLLGKQHAHTENVTKKQYPHFCSLSKNCRVAFETSWRPLDQNHQVFVLCFSCHGSRINLLRKQEAPNMSRSSLT